MPNPSDTAEGYMLKRWLKEKIDALTPAEVEYWLNHVKSSMMDKWLREER